MPSNALFAPMFTTAAMHEAVGAESWLQATLDTEAALAAAEAKVGVISLESAEAIRAACRPEYFDASEIGRAGAAAGNPVVPLVDALRARLPASVAADVHRGATSQDILDTAAALIWRRAIALLLADLDRAAAACAALARAHGDTLMAARTLMQQAVPTTFGFKAAGWLGGLLEVRELLERYRLTRPAVQFGGAAGTLASLDADGPAVARAFAAELGLAEPLMPWHTARARVAELAALLGVTSGAAGKAALDIALLSQSEVGEVAERTAPGRGRSSAMPHKRNPVGVMAVNACVRRAQAIVPVLMGAMLQEHERALGAWQAEWEPLGELFELTGAAVATLADVLDGLQVDTAAMRRNLDATGGLVMAEGVAAVLAPILGRDAAQSVVQAAAGRAIDHGTTLREELLQDPAVAARIPVALTDAALDPAGYLGSAQYFTARVLAAYEATRPRQEEGHGSTAVSRP